MRKGENIIASDVLVLAVIVAAHPSLVVLMGCWVLYVIGYIYTLDRFTSR